MVARTEKTRFKRCAMARWSAVVLLGAGTVAYLAAMTTGPVFLAWGVVFGATLVCLGQIRQGRVSFGTRYTDCPNARATLGPLIAARSRALVR
jgi:hypothetical protein